MFDPRDYKLDVVPSHMSSGVRQKWRHEVEIYVDTIGPSSRGVKLVLQQARHSALPLLPTVKSTNDSFQKANHANNDMDPYDLATVD